LLRIEQCFWKAATLWSAEGRSWGDLLRDERNGGLRGEDWEVIFAPGATLISHPKAGRVAARFRVGTKLLPSLVLSEDKTTATVG